MCRVRHPAPRLRGRNNQNKHSRRNRGKAEWIGSGAHEDLRGDGSARFFLVMDDWARTMQPDGVVAVMSGQMGMKRLTVMVFVLLGVEMHVQERRADRACLHQHDEGRRGQPAKHRGIVAKDQRPGT